MPTDAFLNIAEVQVFPRFKPTLDVGLNNNQVVVAWDSDAFTTPTLQTTTALGGQWTDVTTTTPFSAPITGAAFYRLIAR